MPPLQLSVYKQKKPAFAGFPMLRRAQELIAVFGSQFT